MVKKRLLRRRQLCLFALLITVLMLCGCRNQAEKQPADETLPQNSEMPKGGIPMEEAEKPKLEFPYTFEENKLRINSLFLYSGANPDNDWEEGTDIGAIELVNISEKHLISLDLTVTLGDGTELNFRAEEIPAGQTVLMFSPENAAAYDVSGVENLKCQAVFAETKSLIPDEVTAEAEGTNVTLTNCTDSELSDLTLWCHSMMADSYFGGQAFAYPVEAIAPGESVVVDAADCFLGETAAVWLGQDTRN